MVYVLGNGKAVLGGGGSPAIFHKRPAVVGALPTLPTFNAAATTQPLEITVGTATGNNSRNSDAQVTMHNDAEIALLAIAKTPDQTAAQDGWWDDTATWGGTLPIADDHVLIPAGIKVWVRQNIPKIKTCLNHGFFGVWEDASVNALIEIETFIGSRTSMFWVGDVSRPIMGDVEFLQPQTSLNLTDDPNMQGKGIILLGRSSVCGKTKTPYMLTNGTDLSTAATSVTLASVPTGWAVGDLIGIPPITPIVPSSINGGTVDPGNQSEYKTISDITSNVVTWVGGLTHDHIMPPLAKNSGEGAIQILNLTRNVAFNSPSGAAVHERGHVMLMHTNGGSDWRYAAFHYMGRTDKRVNAHAFADHPDQPTMAADSNIFGRYCLHLHLNGPDPVDTNHVQGCAFYNGYGAGLVVHSSECTVLNNCSAKFNGPQFMSEGGNEAGVVNGWVAMDQETQISDFSNKSGDNEVRHDWGQAQMMWWQSRIPVYKNMWLYGSSGGTGWVANIRGSKKRTVRRASLDLRNIGPAMRYTDALISVGGEFYDANQSLPHIPPLRVENVTTVACTRGGHVIKDNSKQNHGLYSKLTGLRAWNCGSGFQQEYTARYWWNDIKGNEHSVYEGFAGAAFESLCLLAIEAFQTTYRDIEGDNFNYGVNIDHNIANPPSLGPAPANEDWHNFVVVPNTGTLAGTYRIADLHPAVGADAKDVVLQENQVGTGPAVFVLDAIDVANTSNNYPNLTGEITDSAGTRSLPAGRDDFKPNNAYFHGAGQTLGCWEETVGGKHFIELEDWYTDALTGNDNLTFTRLYFDAVALTGDTRPAGGHPASWVPADKNGVKA